MNMEGEGSPPPSMYMIKAQELFPKPLIEREDDKLMVPFVELAGEAVKFLGATDDGVLALSNYRIFLLKHSIGSETSVPLGLIESVQCRDLFQLIVNCKDASTVKCSFITSEQCTEWQRRISLSVGVPENLETLFAFPFHAWASELTNINQDNEWAGRLQRAGNYDDDFEKEVERLQFDLEGAWRISNVNSEFKLCPSYPRKILVPACISDDTLQNVASFRSSRRIPVVVWRHQRTGAIIARCSQPEVGWLGWRNSKDEQLLKALSDACSFDKGSQPTRTRTESTTSTESSPPSPEGSHEEVNMDEPKKILIVDARSYTSAVTNRARGGGCECAEYYPSAEIQFMSLGNIHVIRKSFHALRQLCASQPDIPNWLGLLERTMWLQHLSGLLASSVVVSHAIERNGRPVLVHCSDGWDRTPQIVATAQLCLDPYYRTIEGFRILVEREWLNFGHKFSDRCGHGPGSDEPNERCPVFLQWLDCVHQIHRQFPCSFEFDMGFLIKLAQHSHSCLFGTFLCNTVKERQENSIPDRTFSVWPFLSGPMYKNHLYVPNRERVLWPAHNVRDLALWAEVYLGSWGGNQNTFDYPSNNSDGIASGSDISTSMTKTRSYGDLVTGVNQGGLTRRSSDPNMSVESNMLNISQDNSIDSNASSDREVTPDLIATIATIQDTTQKLLSMTQDLNQSDDELENSIKHSNAFKKADCLDRVTQQLQNSSLHLSNENGLEHEKNLFIENNHNNYIYHSSYVPDDSCNAIDISSLDVQVENGSDLDVTDGNLSPTFHPYKSQSDSMLQSVDLNDKEPSISSSESPPQWHGSVETSTDTLVPYDQYPSEQENHPKRLLNDIQYDSTSSNLMEDSNSNLGKDLKCIHSTELTIDTGDNNGCDEFSNRNCDKDQKNQNLSNKPMIESRFKDLPDVHGISNLNLLNNNNNNTKNKTIVSYNAMEESIIMQPQFQQMEINGKHHQNNPIENNFISGYTFSHQNQNHFQRRRRNSSNSKADYSPNKVNNGSISPSATSNSKYSSHDSSVLKELSHDSSVLKESRSLPLTPPSVPFIIERPVALSCPDGLAHALSEQNLRLQQIVYEHKLREEALQRELYATRLALLKKTCHHCNNQPFNNDEQTSMVDSMVENASVGSWEAVDDRSATSSGANSNSLQQQNLANSVLWVPDHAVSRCTNCKFEFWLGRRKHHCRSCGQIFCADCSEFWAPLPEEKLYHPVRLCKTCYTEQTQNNPQHSQLMKNSTSMNGNCTSSENGGTFPIVMKQTTSTSILEPCKHAAASCGPTTNERGSYKATTATN